jgi:hypothetical protein
VRRFLWTAVTTGIITCSIGVAPASAQLNTQHIKGVVGLKGGTQPPPHTYLIAPLLYVYNSDTVRLRNGTKLPIDAEVTSLAAAGGVSHVTNKRLLGGLYGFQVLFPVYMNNLLQGTEIDANPGGGLSDSAVVPISLGWHSPRADAIASYTIFIPTGRYSDGANDNTGFGMWGQEVGFGTTVYLTSSRQFHAATLASFTFQSEKEDSETKVGTAMNLEGGVGADFLGGGLTVGLVYYSSFKLTADQLGGFPINIEPAKAKVFALGPEVSLALARRGVLYGIVKMNYQWETYARAQAQGSEFNVSVSFLVKPLKLPTP